MKMIKVKVTPNARNSELTELADGTWVAQIKSPPVNGKANEELVTLVARQFGRKKSQVSVKSGASGRMKLVKIEDA